MSHESVVLDDVTQVTSSELITRLKALSRDSHRRHARLLVHLGEVEARGLYRDYAYASMFAYCFEELRMSESEAYLRIQAARLSRKFPLILTMLREGKLHLIGIKLLGPHLTADNHAELLTRASGKRKREILRLVAAIAPKPDGASRMRKLPEPRSARRSGSDVQSTLPESGQALFALGATVGFAVDGGKTRIAVAEVCASNRAQSSSPASPTVTRMVDARESSGSPACLDTPELTITPSLASLDSVVHPGRESRDARFALEAPRTCGSSTPLRPGRYKVEFTAGQGLHKKLAQLQELLRDQVPDGDLAVIVERAADLLIENTMQTGELSNELGPERVGHRCVLAQTGKYEGRAT